MDLNIWHYLLITVGINILMFIPAFIFKTDKFTDITCGLTFCIVAVIARILYHFSWANTILALMVIFWGMRLGSFLLIRVHKMKRDKRFDGRRESFWRFLQFWLLQGVSAWIIMIPALPAMAKNEVRICHAGLLIWAAGLIIESLADAQKYRFNNNPENKGKFIDTGLWKNSRHPNYFGEILCWQGVYIFVFLSFPTAEKLLAFIGPLYITLLLLFVSGIPTVEKRSDEKFGQDPAYLEYKRGTNILIPWPKKKWNICGFFVIVAPNIFLHSN